MIELAARYQISLSSVKYHPVRAIRTGINQICVCVCMHLLYVYKIGPTFKFAAHACIRVRVRIAALTIYASDPVMFLKLVWRDVRLISIDPSIGIPGYTV